MPVRIYETRTKTHLIRAAEAIDEAMNDYANICSENWSYPVRHFGTPEDKYYAEIWQNGMDWQSNFWIIESVNWSDPKPYPLIIFEDNSQLERFHKYDFNQLLDAVCWYRRDSLWIMDGDPHYGAYGDTVWPFLNRHPEVPATASPLSNETKTKIETERVGKLFLFSHASQPAIKFYLNTDFIPEKKRK